MKKYLVAFSVFVAPALAFAQVGNQNPEALGLLIYLLDIVKNLLIPIASTLVVVYFFYGLAKYVLASGDEDAAKEGKSIMIWGSLAMFVMVTIWGIIAFLQTTIGNTDPVTVGNITFTPVQPGQASQLPPP